MSYLFVVYDKTTNYGSQIMEFSSKELAVTVVRQQVRDTYLKGQISADFVINNTLICIGEYDPVSLEINPYGYEAIYYGMRDFIKDLEFTDYDVRCGTNSDNDKSGTSDSGVPGDSVLRV